MKKTKNLLNFNVDRDLEFKAFRQVDLVFGRGLSFDIDRGLSFDASRDLGFGIRGIKFRGYVCPECGAAVTKGVDDCYNCGIRFKWPNKGEKKSASRPKPPAMNRGVRDSWPSVPETFLCPVCGRMLQVGTDSCPGCNLIFRINSQNNACTQCGGSMAPQDRFCRVCGTPRNTGAGKEVS